MPVNLRFRSKFKLNLLQFAGLEAAAVYSICVEQHHMLYYSCNSICWLKIFKILATTADGCKILSHLRTICILWISVQRDFSRRWIIAVKICSLPGLYLTLPLPLLSSLFFPPSSPWVSKCGPHICVEPNMGSRTALHSAHLATGQAQAMPILTIIAQVSFTINDV